MTIDVEGSYRLLRAAGPAIRPQPPVRRSGNPLYNALMVADATINLKRQQIGRDVDLRTPNDLSRYFRDAVLREALPLHAA